MFFLFKKRKKRFEIRDCRMEIKKFLLLKNSIS